MIGRAARAVIAMLSIAVLACGCTDDGPSGDPASSSSLPAPRTPAQLLERWPADVDGLVTAGSLDSIATAAGRVLRGTVVIRGLERHGGVLARKIGSSSQANRLDLIVASRPAGYRPTDARTLRGTVLRAVLEPAGLASFAATIDTLFSTGPFRGTGGSYGNELRGGACGDTRISGFMATAKTCGTSISFVAHGMGVVIVASTLSRDQAEKVVTALQR